MKKEAYYYPYIDDNGKERFRKVIYTLYFDEEILSDVRNEFNFSVEKQSEVWDFFSKKYKK